MKHPFLSSEEMAALLSLESFSEKVHAPRAERTVSHPVTPVKVISITAGKGGVGKSNIAVNTAVALASEGFAVLLLDADLGLANSDILLGLTPKYTLSQVIDGTCKLEDILLTGPYGMKLIPASSGIAQMTQLTPLQHAGLINAFNELTDAVDYLIIDTAAGISETVLSFARASQHIIMVVCDEPTSLTDAYAFIKVMSTQYAWRQFHILPNMVRSVGEGEALFNRLTYVCDQFLECQLTYLDALPFDEHMHLAVKQQQPVLVAYPTCPISLAFQRLTKTICHWPSPSLWGGNSCFFLERLAMANRQQLSSKPG